MSEWISVEDRLPEKNQRVLAWYDGYEEHSEVRWRRYGSEFAVFWGVGAENATEGWADTCIEWARGNLGATHLEITHWCPLPGGPESREDER